MKKKEKNCIQNRRMTEVERDQRRGKKRMYGRRDSNNILQEIHNTINILCMLCISVPRLSNMTPPTHTNRLWTRFKEENADNGGAGINMKIRGVRGLWGGGKITSASQKLTSTIPNRQ